jgi:hypothetical protein
MRAGRCLWPEPRMSQWQALRPEVVHRRPVLLPSDGAQYSTAKQKPRKNGTWQVASLI